MVGFLVAAADGDANFRGGQSWEIEVSWIKHIPYQEAEGKLLRLYNRVKGPDDNVDNIMQAHSLRPHTMEGHMVLYKNVLHHTSNEIAKWFLEALGVYTSMQNGCSYCVEHHLSGMARLLNDQVRSSAIRHALETESFTDAFDQQQAAAMLYARKMTLTPGEMVADDVKNLRDVGWGDGEILEINQIVSYFNYANRTVLGLGVNTIGDILGLSPDSDNWRHS